MKDLDTDYRKSKEDVSMVSDPDNRYTPFGLTDIQHAYWIGRSGVAELGDVACHVYFEIETHQIDLQRYTAAWQQVIGRHDMLRAIILPDGRQQVLEDPPLFRIYTQDLRGDASELVLQKKESIREEMSHQVRPADQWPLFEVRATILDDKYTLLHISIDILIADGYSIYNLMQEIDHYYSLPDQSLAPIECTFRDYVLAESAFRETLSSLFIKRVEQQPEHTAVVTSSGRIKYKDLHHRSMVVASLLVARGATANTLVAVVMEKGWEQIVAVLGVLSAGAAYLPIDPAVPRERLCHLLKDGEVKSVLTQSWLEQTLEWPKGVDVCCVDTQGYNRNDLIPLQVKQTPDDLAYVIHTSGPPGFPKGL